MAIERRRGCGYRKVGGLYLVSGGGGVHCDRLPFLLDVCPVCSHGFKQARGWTWVDVAGLVGGLHPDCKDGFPCPLCMDTARMGKAGLLWIGERFYKTPAEFHREAVELGISRRIKAIPRGFKVGETWVLLAHPKAVESLVDVEVDHGLQGEFPVTALEKVRLYKPGIFKVWRPVKIEKLVLESQRGSEEVERLLQQGITPVFVPDDDKDHRGTVYDDEPELEFSTEGE